MVSKTRKLSLRHFAKSLKVKKTAQFKRQVKKWKIYFTEENEFKEMDI
tara:strand:- start:102 stop:245 length:144 start_codon:yes stop_codon:yes gene_type:complete